MPTTDDASGLHRVRHFVNACVEEARHLRAQVDAARRVVRDARQEWSNSTSQFRDEARAALGASEPIIDVGERPSPLARAGRTAAALIVVALALGALATFATFFVQLLVALVIATRVLGLRIDPAILSPR